MEKIVLVDVSKFSGLLTRNGLDFDKVMGLLGESILQLKDLKVRK